MDHPASAERPFVWRTTALVASALAAFELALLVLIGLVFVGSPVGDEAASPVDPKTRAKAEAGPQGSAPAAAPAKAKPKPKLPRAETAVIVLNGNGVDGAAAQATERIRRFPYLVAGTGNAPHTDFARSLVMYRPGYRSEAVRFARDLGLSRVSPLDGMQAADLQGAQVALIVGAS